MNEHYVITADYGHLRVFLHRHPAGQATPGFEQVYSMDFPFGRANYTDRDTDVAGRFNSSKHQSAGQGSPAARTGMSIDERLPMKREEERRQIRNIAEAIDSFLRSRPEASWDFAAAPAVHQAVLDALAAQLRVRLRHSIAKDLVNQPRAELATHFAHP